LAVPQIIPSVEMLALFVESPGQPMPSVEILMLVLESPEPSHVIVLLPDPDGSAHDIVLDGILLGQLHSSFRIGQRTPDITLCLGKHSLAGSLFPKLGKVFLTHLSDPSEPPFF
jgi:hypothetical protein